MFTLLEIDALEVVRDTNKLTTTMNECDIQVGVQLKLCMVFNWTLYKDKMAAAYYKQQDHIRRVSARSFLTNISLDGSHRDTCYGKLVASRRHAVQAEAAADALQPGSRGSDQLSRPICPVSGSELHDMVYDDVTTADTIAADEQQQNSSELNLFRYEQLYCCCCLLQTTLSCRPPVKCGCAGLRVFKRVNCGEILRGLSADVMGKMRRCGYVIKEGTQGHPVFFENMSFLVDS